MSSAEFSEWVAFFSLEPFGYEADFFPQAQITAMIANVNRAKDQEPFHVSDFMPKEPTAPPEPQSVESMMTIANAMTLGGFGTLISEDEDI